MDWLHFILTASDCGVQMVHRQSAVTLVMVSRLRLSVICRSTMQRCASNNSRLASLRSVWLRGWASAPCQRQTRMRVGLTTGTRDQHHTPPEVFRTSMSSEYFVASDKANYELAENSVMSVNTINAIKLQLKTETRMKTRLFSIS